MPPPPTGCTCGLAVQYPFSGRGTSSNYKYRVQTDPGLRGRDHLCLLSISFYLHKSQGADMNFAPVVVVLLVVVVVELTSKAPLSGPLPDGREVPKISFLGA
jgi:hypothetical protein